MNLIEECKTKTAYIMSFPPIKYYIEKGLNEITSGFFIKKSQFAELIENFRGDLTRSFLTNREVDQLKKLDIKIYYGGQIILLPFLNYPLVGYNLKNIPYLFLHPGWLFHATNDIGLHSMSKSGYLISPTEMILEKKEYLSERFNVYDKIATRITDGISFAFQDASIYQIYTKRVKEKGRKPVGIGGFLIFPLGTVLKEDFILSFDVVDKLSGFPEIDLRYVGQEKLKDERQIYFAKILATLIYLKASYDKLLQEFDNSDKFFSECKNKINNIKILNSELSKNSSPHHFENTEFSDFIKKIDYIRLPFQIVVSNIIKFVEENDFFSFLLLVNNSYFDYEHLIPKYSIYAINETPPYIRGTIFDMGLNAYLIPDLNDGPTYMSIPGIFLLAEIQRNKKVIASSIFEETRKFSNKDLARLIKLTRYRVIKSIETFVPYTRVKNPLKVDIRSGVLFLTRKWYKEQLNKEIDSKEVLRRFVNIGVPLILGFGTDINDTIDSNIVRYIIHNLLQAKDLPPLPDEEKSILDNRIRRSGYFYCRNVNGNKEIFYKSQNHEIRID